MKKAILYLLLAILLFFVTGIILVFMYGNFIVFLWPFFALWSVTNSNSALLIYSLLGVFLVEVVLLVKSAAAFIGAIRESHTA